MGQPRPGPGLRRGRHRARPGRDEHPRLEGHPLGAAHPGNKLSDDKRALVNQIARTNRRIGRAWTLNEQLRDVYRTHHPPGGARQYLRRWITAAKRSRINARGYGHHSAQTLSSMIYLCLGGLHPQLPTKT